ncbi:MAG: leucine-rich repeat protein, partial [Muribaculaceae bacterium]|nr:leucine-rich repeat protein [Muribaculaceae bacterium]
GEGAFYWCSSLTSVVIGNSVTSIGKWAFWNCENLTSIEIPNSVTSIGDWALDNCSSLTSIEIPNSVTSIGYSAFSKCSSLTSIQIGNSVTSIGTCVFSDCNSLTSIVVDSGNTKYDSRNDCNAIIKTASNTLIAGCQNTIIPNSVTSIGNEAFYNCSSLTSIEIPNSVTSIGWYAFAFCTNLKEITCLATTPPAMYVDTFSDYSASLFVPEGYISDYQSADYWNNFNITEISLICSSIKLNRTSVTIKTTETIALNAIVFPKYATNKSVIWKSSNETIATVDTSGVVTAIAGGEAIITATTTDGSNLSASCKVTVIPTLAESITLDKTEISLGATETATLVATVLPELTTDKSVKWSSSDEMVAIVDEKGVVTAISLGEVTITATTTDGSNLSATCQVTVVPTLAVYIELDQTEASIEEKSELQLTATILPEHATNKEVAWSSSDKWVASVDNTGLVTIYSAGEVIITATTTDGTNLSATCRINVYSGIDGVNGDDVIVATVGDNIVVKNAPLGSVINVYASNGALVATEVVTDGDVVVETPIKGIYIVSVNGKNFKVMVK